MEKDQVLNHFVFLNKLGDGAFSEVFAVQDKRNFKIRALKRETKPTPHDLLKHEANVLKTLSNIDGIPKFYEYIETEEYNYMIMQKLGESVQTKLEEAGSFSLESCLEISS